MRVYLAQLRKDIGATWPLLALWTGGLLLLAALHFGPLNDLKMAGMRLATFLEFLPVLITALIVLQEPLSDTDAFWQTRPLPVGTLLGSKLTLIALLVIAPAVVLQAFSFATLDLPGSGPVPVLAQTALWMLALVIFAWLPAVVSRSLPTFVAWLITAYLVTNFGMMLILAPLYRAVPSLESLSGPQMTVIGIAIGLLAIFWRYRTRRLVAFLPLALTAFLLLRIGPYTSAFKAPVDGYHAEGKFTLAKLPQQAHGTPSADYINVSAMLLAPRSGEAVPQLYDFQVDLTFPDGRVFESASGIESHYSNAGAGASGLAPLPKPDYSIPALLSIPATDFSQYAEQRGRLTVRLSGYWESPRPVDIPARTGETWTDQNSRYTVRELRLESTQLLLLVDEVRIGQHQGGISPTIYNPNQMEILQPRTSSGGSGGERPRPLVISHPYSETTEHEFTKRFGPRSRYGAQTTDGYRYRYGPVDSSWLEGARLRFNTATKLGEIEEVITIEDFRIADWL